LPSLKETFSFLKWIDPFTYSDLLLEKINPGKNEAVNWAVYFVTAFVSALLLYAVLGLIFQSPSPMVIVVSESMDPAFHRGDVMVLSGWLISDLKAETVELPMQIDGLNLGEYATTICSVEGQEFFIECRSLAEEMSDGIFAREQVEAKAIYFPLIDKEIPVTKDGDVVVYFSKSHGIPVIHRAVAKIQAEDGLFILTKGDSKMNSFVDQDTSLAPSAARVDELHGKAIFMIPWIGYVKLILLDDIPCYLASGLTGHGCQFP